MFRIILLLAALGAIFYAIRRLKQLKQDKGEKQTSHEDTARCAHCGIHIPTSEAIQKNGKDYCSHEHADLDV